jgi:hypothetical protein
MKLPNELLLRFERVLLDKLNELTHESIKEEVSPGIFIESEIGYIPFLVDVYSYPLTKSRRYIAREHFGYYSLIALDEPVYQLKEYLTEHPLMCPYDYMFNHFIVGALIHLKCKDSPLFEGEYLRMVIETIDDKHLINNPITIPMSELIVMPSIGSFIPVELCSGNLCFISTYHCAVS